MAKTTKELMQHEQEKAQHAYRAAREHGELASLSMELGDFVVAHYESAIAAWYRDCGDMYDTQARALAQIIAGEVDL